MPNQSDNKCFYSDDFEDYQKQKITLCWTEKLWNKHVNKHIEIVDPVTTSKLIRDALLNPSLVITGKRPNASEELVCYYKEHKRNQTDVYFTKVVIGRNGSKLYVKTVFMEWALCIYAVQEKKYNFKELYRDTNTYL